MLKVVISHSIIPLHTEKRVDADTTVAALKDKLYMIVGTPPEYQTLQLRDEDGNVLRVLEPDESPLSAFGLQEYAYVHVIDSDPNQTVKGLQDVTQVEKYEISEESYEKRPDNFRRFKEKFLQKDPEKLAEEQVEKEATEQHETELAAGMKVGDRCEYGSETENPARGEIVYVGPVHFSKFEGSVWIGVKLDEPVGKHNGTVKGTTYFEVENKHGLLTRPSRLQVGDFPEKDPFDDLDDSDDDDDEDVMKEL